MIEKIAELVRDKKIEGIGDLRDESDRDGVRVVIELQARCRCRRGAEPALPLLAAADQSFGVNMLALNGGRPQNS